MSGQALDLRRSAQIVWRLRALVGAIIALGFLGGAAYTALTPASYLSNAVVVLSPSIAIASQAAVVDSPPVLADALTGVDRGMSLQTLRSRVQTGPVAVGLMSISVVAAWAVWKANRRIGVLAGLLALGIATAVREAAVAIGLVLGLLYLFPIVSSVVGNQHWQRHLEQIGPMNAGLYVQATVGLKVLPLTPGRASPSSPPGPAARCCSAAGCCGAATPDEGFSLATQIRHVTIVTGLWVSGSSPDRSLGRIYVPTVDALLSVRYTSCIDHFYLMMLAVSSSR